MPLIQYNKLQKESNQLHEILNKSSNSNKEMIHKDNFSKTEIDKVNEFFLDFHPKFLNEIENPDLFISLIKSQLLNLCVQKNHRTWDNISKAVFWHEYFHKNTLGSGIYKMMPCYNTVKKFFEKKIEQYYLSLTNIELIDPVLMDMISNAQRHSIIPDLNKETSFKIYCT